VCCHITGTPYAVPLFSITHTMPRNDSIAQVHCGIYSALVLGMRKAMASSPPSACREVWITAIHHLNVDLSGGECAYFLAILRSALSFASPTPHGRIANDMSQGLTVPLFYPVDGGVCSMPRYTWDGTFYGQILENATNSSAPCCSIPICGNLIIEQCSNCVTMLPVHPVRPAQRG